MKRISGLFISMALCILGAASCNKDTFSLSKGSGISVKVSGTAALATKSAAVETIVLKSLDAGAPDLYVVATPYTPDEPSTRSAAVTSATIGSVYPTFYLDAYIDGQSEAYFDHKGVTYDAGKNEWALEHDGEDEPYRWSWNKEKDKFDEIAFWALACDGEFSGMYDSVSDDSASLSFSYNDFKSGQATPYTKDLLVAYNKKSEGTLEIKFAHALAAVSAIVDPEQEPDAVIKDCSFNNVLSAGTCTCEPAGESVSFTWEASGPESYAASFEGTDALSADNLHFIIPQTLGSDATVSITVEKNGTTRTHTYSLSGTKWDAGKKYVYKLGYPSGAILMNGPAFWDAVNLLVSSSAVIENVEFKVASPISDYPSLPYTMVQDPTSKAKIYAVYDSSTKKLIVTTGADEMFTNVSMEKMFYGYKSKYSEPRDGAFGALKSIDFGPLNTVKTTNMKNTFCWNVTLTSADFNKLDVSNVTTFDHTFFRCNGFETIDISAWETKSATDMENMFDSCANLKEVKFDPEKFDVSKVKFMHYMFCNCPSLEEIDLTSWNTANLQNTVSMFSSCTKLEKVLLNPDTFTTGKVIRMTAMFSSCKSLTQVDVSKFDLTSCITTKDMFKDCSSLESLDVSNWTTTGAVTEMASMFMNCEKLSTLDVSKWDVSKVNDMLDMFYSCKSLTSLAVSDWNTSSLTNMAQTFMYCENLVTLDVSKWNVSRLKNMQQAFFECKSLTSLPVTDWNTSSLTNLHQTFMDCTSLTSMDTSKWVTDKVTDMYLTFSNCSAMPSFDLSNFSTEVLETTYGMFDNCKSATEIKLDPSKFVCAKDTNMDYMFRSCEALTSLDLSGLTGENCTITHCMFQDCKALPTLDLRKFQTAKVDNCAYMFQNCESLNPLQVDNTKFTFDAATTMEHMFDNCNKLETVDVTGFKTSNVTTMAFMFYLCQSLDSVDVTKFDTRKVTNMESMFRQCNVLPNVDVSHFETDIVTTMDYMFAGCYQLQALAVEGWNVEKVQTMDYMFEACWNLATLDVSHFNTGACTSFRFMFQSCYKLKVIDVSGFNTAAAEYMNAMFNGCYEVETLDTSRWNTAKVKRMDQMFQQCKSLKSVNLLSFNTANTWNMSNMFMDCFSLEEIDLSSFNTARVNSYSGGSLGGMFALSGQTADYISVLRKITLGANFVVPNNAKKKNLMQNTGKDIAAGVIICTDEAWASIIDQPTLTSTGTQINLTKWSHQTL